MHIKVQGFKVAQALYKKLNSSFKKIKPLNEIQVIKYWEKVKWMLVNVNVSLLQNDKLFRKPLYS